MFLHRCYLLYYDDCNAYMFLHRCYLLYYDCNTVDNIYVKTCKPLGSQNGQIDLVNKYGSNQSLKMTHASRNMSL